MPKWRATLSFGLWPLRVVPIEDSEFVGTRPPDHPAYDDDHLIFFIATTDHPYSGSNAIEPLAYEIVLRYLEDYN